MLTTNQNRKIESLLRRRQEINYLLLPHVARLFDPDQLTEEVWRCIKPGRKIRSLLFLESFRGLSPNPDSNTATVVMTAIELFHAASILVDDLLDGDDTRHGAVSTQKLWDTSKSVLLPHLMTATAIRSIASKPALQGRLVDTYREMALGELYDVFIPHGDWISGGYDVRTYRKTAALFSFVFYSAHELAESARAGNEFERVGRDLGILFQISNDYFDWQPQNVMRRHQQRRPWLITFSFPLATYLSHHDQTRIEEYLTKGNLSFDEWLSFLTVVWSDEVKDKCRAEITKRQEDLLKAIHRLVVPVGLKQLYVDLVDLLGHEEFWYHEYDVEKP